MGTQLAKSKKGSSENVDRNFSLRINKGKKTRLGDDGSSISSLDMISMPDSDFVTLHAYLPPLNAYDSAIAVQKGDPLRFYGQSSTGEWMDVLCRRTGERGWVPASCVVDPTTSKPLVASTSLSTSIHVSCPSLMGERWYHGAIHRGYAEYLLNSGITGSFLVRESESSFGKLTLSLRSDGRIFHYRICTDENKQFYINEASRFGTVSLLVQHHEKLADGLACPLLYGVSKRDQSHYGGIDYDYDAWEINRTDVIMKHKLGSGQYGVVYEAILKPYDVIVAVKTLKEDITLRDEFLQEARLMKSLRHPNLVRLLGACTQEPPYYIITEFMCNGNLLDYLRTQPRDMLSPPVLLQMAIHVCCAMTYLEEHSFIHRDLAARNCLVSEEMIVKVADFGLARYMERDVTYRAREGAKFPIKWTAPEGLVYNCFSTKSDVWAFGVLLWEIATFGATPYPGAELQDVYVLLEKGTRMEAPQGCPDAVYQLMLDCWNWEAADRPSFKEVYAQLETIRISSDINEAVEHKLQRHHIRMPPPPLPPLPPPPITGTTATPWQTSGCDVSDECNPSPVEIARRGLPESLTAKDVLFKRVGSDGGSTLHQHQQQHQLSTCSALPQGCIAPGNRFSEVFPSSLLPPPPPPLSPSHPDTAGFADSATAAAEVSGAGSLRRIKAAPPAPPLRTTTLRGDEFFEKASASLLVSTDDRQSFAQIDEEHSALQLNPALCDANWSSSQSQTSPPLNSDLFVSMTSSVTFGSPSMSTNPRRIEIPVPPQRSESSRSQTASSAKGFPIKSSPKMGLSIAHSPPPNDLAATNSNCDKDIDFYSELSSRLKRQLDGSGSIDCLTRLSISPSASTATSAAAVTAEMIRVSKSKLRATTTTTTPLETQLLPSVPAWKDLVVQRQLKNTESHTGKRMSWTPTSASSSLSPFKPNYDHHLQQFKNADSFSEATEERKEVAEENDGEGDLLSIMSQSMTYESASNVSPSSRSHLSYEELLKQITGLCADLNLAKVNLPNDHSSALADRIEELKEACLSYVDEMDCSAHAKFRFRDECAKIQTATDTVRAICSVSTKATDLGGRRKAFHTLGTTIEALHRSLLRLKPCASVNTGVEESTSPSTGNGFVGTGVIS